MAQAPPRNIVDSVPVEDALEAEFHFSSQGSSVYDDDGVCELIRDYVSQPSTQRMTSGRSSNDSSLQIPPSTQSSSTTKSSERSSSSASIVELGKRKATSELLSSEQPSLKRQALLQQRLAGPLAEGKPVFQDHGHFVDPYTPVVNTPPQIMAGLFATLPYGAQFEFTRLVNNERLKFEDVSMEMYLDIKERFKTNVAAAPAIERLVAGTLRSNKSDDAFAGLFEKENRARNPWEELDMEEEALAIDQYGAMGFDKDGAPSEWCGGHVQFRGSLFAPLGSDELKLKLEKPSLGPSSQLARRFGSKQFFRIKITKAAQRVNPTRLLNYFRRPFIICGGVFRAFYSKDDNIFLFKTNEFWTGNAVEACASKSGGMDILEFINWHNPISLNIDQAMAKWASRFSLGLSNSAPGYLLPRDSIKFMDDIVNETNANMTDGAGSLNRCLVRRLRHRYDWNERPSAFQVRVHGGKGLLIEDIVDHSEIPVIFLTPSQIKIKYDVSDNDPAHLAVDILRASHLKTPCRLSAETIVNLGENGVPRSAFVTLLEASLAETVTPLLNWDGQQALLELWGLVQRRGGVLTSRRAREQPGIARLKGWSERDLDENENDDEDGFTQLDTAEQRSSAWWADPIGGSPSSLEETVMYLLDSGFEPNSCPVLREKLKNCVKGYVRREIESFHIEVPMSATCFITPDRRGLLAEDEVFFKSSSRNLMLTDGTCTDVMVGDVLLARHPCKLPTDIRKWKAVDHPELHQLVDVIVFPTRGSRRAADWLAGGDYDGDKAILIWQPELVTPFTNADAKYADPPEDMSKFFEKDVEHASEFLRKIAEKPSIEAAHQYQYHLLGAIRNASVVGMYSKFHDNAIYTKGYSHPITRRLAFMFCMTLDGAKTGMSVKSDVLERDRAKFGRRAPAWKETEEDLIKSGQTNDIHPTRPTHLSRFIMDDLCKEAKRQGDLWGAKIEDKFRSCTNQGIEDPDLAAPYKEIVRKAQGDNGGELYLSDLQLIRKHVEKIFEEHDEQVRRDQVQRRERESGRTTISPRKSPRKDNKDSVAFSDRRIEERQDILRGLSRRFAESPSPHELHMPADHAQRVKASYAFVYDCEKRQNNAVKWSRFPWDVAFRELCDIKARAIGNHKSVCAPFYERMAVKIPKIA